MKKLLFTLSAVTVLGMVQAQNTLITKPGPGCGLDAIISRNDVTTLNWQTTNNGNATEVWAAAWTFYASGGGPGQFRSLIDFADLDCVPTGATVVSATLRLYGVPSSVWFAAVGNSNYPGSPYTASNACWVQRVTSTWTENAVTWNTQPTATTTNQVAIPASTSQWNYSVALNVTALVQDMVNQSPANRFGFRIMLQNEAYYRSLGFASSDHATAGLWPELEVVYTFNCAQPLTGNTGDNAMDPDVAGATMLYTDSELALYPNPSEGSVTLHFTTLYASEATISVTNTLGQEMKKIAYKAEKGDCRYVLDLSGLAAGNYSVSIQFADTNNPALHQQLIVK